MVTSQSKKGVVSQSFEGSVVQALQNFTLLKKTKETTIEGCLFDFGDVAIKIGYLKE